MRLLDQRGPLEKMFTGAKGRQIDREGRAAPDLAFHKDVTFRLLHEAVHHCQPESRPLSDLFGGEERLEYMSLGLGVDAATGIADRHAHVAAGQDFRKPLTIPSVEEF